MKKLIILISIAIVLIAGGVVAYLYFNNLQKLTVTFKQPDIAGVIYKVGTDSHEGSDDQEIQKIEGSQTISLPKGDYYLRPQGKNVLDTEMPFTLADEPVSIDVDPGFTTDYLAEQLKAEKPKIDAALAAKYPQIAQYTVSEGQLFAKGEWFGANLTQTADTQDEKDIYKVILHKENDQWSVVGKPEIAFYKDNYSNVPIDVLRDINRLNQAP